jgi:hypothetical protein
VRRSESLLQIESETQNLYINEMGVRDSYACARFPEFRETGSTYLILARVLIPTYISVKRVVKRFTKSNVTENVVRISILCILYLLINNDFNSFQQKNAKVKQNNFAEIKITQKNHKKRNHQKKNSKKNLRKKKYQKKQLRSPHTHSKS